jgi:hypothetical protein
MHTTVGPDPPAEAKRRNAERFLGKQFAIPKAYALTIKVEAAQIEDLENYLTDNLIQIIAKSEITK